MSNTSIQIGQERLLQVLLSPHMTEKAMRMVKDNRQHTFKVATNAKKDEIKKAVELLFKVEVERVNITNVKGKSKRFGQRIGRRSDWKKAYVKLKEGNDIDFVGKE